LKGIWKKWLFVSEKIGNFMSRVILTLLYFTIFAIPGIASRLFTDKLQIKKRKTSYWVDIKDKVPKDIEESRNQG
jgi:hypothetical protein